jgi:RHS repeat-associated protein
MTTDRISAATTFTYTPLGQLASLTDAENQTTSYTYDARGLKLTETYPDHTGGSTVGQTGYGIVTFVYDNAGRVLLKQDQLGVTLTHSYDLAGRMTRRDYRTAANSPSGTIADSDTFTFDRASRMRTAVNGRYTNTVTYTFDPVGRKATEALTISNVTYTTRQAYNARNELTTITYPNNTTSTRSYHPTGTLNQLGLDGSTVSTRSYDAGRRQTTDVLSNGITETRTYRNDNLLSAINYSNTSLGNMTYTWDANKNKTSESITGVMSGYGFTAAGTTYDFEDRLTGFSRAATSGPALLSQSWNLTTVGDWTSVTTNGTAQSRTHGPTHELLTAGGQNVATDVKGNITTLPANLRPAGATTAMNLTWDSDNKLRSADIDANGTADVNFQYDALGRRVARSGTGGSVVFVQMDQQTIADYPVGGAATTPTFRYVYASYIDEPVVRKGPTSTSTVHFYHRNHQYSVTAITTSTGAIAERYAYTAYGQPTILNASGAVISATTLSNRYTYTGREWDATLGLHHFRARWMSPSSGRFLTRDPMRYISGWNISSSYLGLKKLDPLGMYADDPKPPFPNAVGPDDNGCFKMKFQDFIDMISNGQPLPDVYLKRFRAGCIGLTRCGQLGGTCSNPMLPPEYAENTTCAKAQKSPSPIPDSILKKKCAEDETPFIFAKQGVGGGKGAWPVGDDDCYKIPPFKFPPNPPVVGSGPDGGPDPLSGIFNYIWYVNGWYVWVNHGIDVQGQGDSMVSICPQPYVSDDYPLTMWCVTCKKKCPTSKFPIFPEPPVPPTQPKR